MNTPQIERFEWDFDSCPDDELVLCFEYERARNSREQQEIKQAEDWRRMFPKWASVEDRKAGRDATWIAQVEGATFDDYWKQILADNYPPSAVCLYPEFPLRSYLTIPEPERRRRFALIAAIGIYPVAALDATLGFEEAFDDLRGNFWIDVSKGSGITHHGSVYEIEGNAIKCPEMRATWGLFRFDWSCSDKAFIDALKVWLDKNRDRTVKIHDARGGGSEIRQIRAQLNQLGAWRLLNFPMKWDEAMNHTALVRAAEPLYSEQPAWIRARNAADSFLGMLNG